MNPKTLVPLLLALGTTLAGCLTPGNPPASENVSTAANAPATSDMPGMSMAPGAATGAPVALKWSQHWLAGAALELPSHLVPSEAVSQNVWKSGFILNVTPDTKQLELALDMDATAAQVIFMVHMPHSESDSNGWPGFSEPPITKDHMYGYSDAKHRCMAIPQKDIMPGHWYVMIHTAYSVNLNYTITVTSVGGNSTILPDLHGHSTSPETALNLAHTLKGDMDAMPTEKCQHDANAKSSA